MEHKEPPKIPPVPPFQFTVDNCWSAFDKIVHVSSAMDKQTADMFATHNIPFESFVYDTDKQNPQRAKFNMHIAAMKSALEDEDLKNMLIFDERVALRHLPTKSVVEDVLRFVRQQDFDLLMLGARPNVVNDRVTRVNSFRSIFKMQAASAFAYVVSRSFMERIVKMNFDTLNAPIETLFSINSRSFAVLPTWFHVPVQDAMWSMYDRAVLAMENLYGTNAGTYPATFVFATVALIVIVVLLLLLFFR